MKSDDCERIRKLQKKYSKENSSDSDHSDSDSEWSDNSIHGGEPPIKAEVNTLDKIIDQNLGSERLNELYNGIQDHELTHDSNIAKQNAKRHATPTSTANIRTGTKSQRHQIDGLYLLFDSGSSDSMIKLQLVKHLKHKFVKNKTEYSVAGGVYKTNKEVKVNFSLLEFNDNKVINWKF